MSSVEEGPIETFSQLSGGRFRVLRDGSGGDIVWVPGGDSSADYWREQFSYFRGSWRCTSYDPRGAGETQCDPPPWSMDDFARDCAEIIEQYCKPPVILTGLSMGALITQQVAIDYPHLVRLAIPMGTAAHITGFTRDWMEAEIAARANNALSMPPDFAACHYAAFAYPAQALGDQALWNRIREAYRERFANRESEHLIGQWQACLDYDVTDSLGTCPVPIHAVAFSEDVQTPPQLVRKVAESAMNGTYHELPGLGHVSLYRHAGEQVNAFLETLITCDLHSQTSPES